MLRAKSPYINKPDCFMSSDKLLTTSTSIIQEKIVERDGEVTYK